MLNCVRSPAYIRLEQVGHVLQPTALVHEAYIKFADLNRLRWQDRAHLYGVTALLMRQVICDYGRKQKALKYGGDSKIVPISRLVEMRRSGHDPIDLLTLNEVLDRLEQEDPSVVQVVELR